MRSLKQYTLRRISGDGHMLGDAVQASHPSDFSAIKAARAMTDCCDVEVWQGQRLVAYVVSSEAPNYPPIGRKSRALS